LSSKLRASNHYASAIINGLGKLAAFDITVVIT
jgi:hypothetical protein